ncbi:MAG: Polysaccharide biosynthesis protein [Actinobacteria bacterium]|nr:Polysaccharide biosynthesis protein [Actinomycetota bacterium]MCW3043271.1 Polysaccharide biosynthesis protein [Actinomycetota bacterium]
MIDAADGLPRPVPMALEKPKRRNVFALGGAQLITWSITLLWTFIVPRHLGAAGWGLLVTGSSIGGLLIVLMGSGTGNYLVRQFVRDPQKAPSLLGTSLVTRVALVIPGAAVLVLYLKIAAFSGQASLIIAIGAAVAVFALLQEPLDSVFQAVERMEYLAAGDVADKVMQSTLAIGLVLLGFGVTYVAVSSLCVAAFVFVLKAGWARKFYRPELRTTLPKARLLARESLPYWTMSLFLTLYVWIDTAMLSVMAPAKVVGWYGVPTRLFGTFQFAGNMLATLWLPRLIRAHEQPGSHFKRVAGVPLGQALLLSLPLAAGGAVVAGPLIRTLFGPDFAGSVPAMAILALCLVPLYLNIMAYTVLVAEGRQVVWTKIIMSASIVNPLLNLVAIHFFQTRHGNGATGAALSLLATEVLISAVSLRVATRGILSRQNILQLLRCLLASAVMAVCVYMARSLGLIPQGLIGVAVFGVLAVALRVPSPEDMATARAIIRRRLRRSGPEMPPPVPGEGPLEEADPVRGQVGEPERGEPGCQPGGGPAQT